jgi:hypothetical protein
MAFVTRFEQSGRAHGRLHDEVECGYSIFDAGQARILQLDTYGSVGRARPGQVSQSLQFDEQAAKELLKLIRMAFPGVSA